MAIFKNHNKRAIVSMRINPYYFLLVHVYKASLCVTAFVVIGFINQNKPTLKLRQHLKNKWSSMHIKQQHQLLFASSKGLFEGGLRKLMV